MTGASSRQASRHTSSLPPDVLNIRSGAGTGHSVVGAIREKAGKKNRYTIVEEKDGWGRLKSGAGWISLSYTKKAS